MRKPCRTTAILCLALLWALLPWVVARAHGPARGLSAQEERGRQIYLTGQSPTGVPISGWFGEDLVEVSLETATCSSCHGFDGTGRPESGVIPTNVTWRYLTKAYGHDHPEGVQHPPFNEKTLRDYMVNGVYPGGSHGDPSMPVYEMADADMDDLIAFMKRLGELHDPGLDERVIRIGTLVPAAGQVSQVGAAIRGILEAYFAEVNRAGGIYGRRLELLVGTVPAGRDAAREATRAWVTESQPFAMVSIFTPGSDLEVQAAASELEVPVVGPLTLYALGEHALRRRVFYVLPGLDEQVKALLRHAAEAGPVETPAVAFVYPEFPELAPVVAAAAWTSRSQGWPEPRRLPFTPATLDLEWSVARLREAAPDVVILLGNEGESRGFLQAAADTGWYPTVGVAGVWAGRLVLDAPAGFADRLFVAYPTLPRDRQPWAVEELSRVAALHDLPQSHVHTMVNAYASARVLVEALRSAGLDLSRRRLIDVLEKLYHFDTGLTPRITYDANRRDGARGAYVVTFDGSGPERESAPEAVWVEAR